MSDLYSVIGTKTYKNLLADPQGADIIAVPLEPGNGELEAGALLYRKSNGFYAPASTSEISTSYNLVVLKEDVDTGTDLSAFEDAAAYRAGCFIDGAVTVTSNGTITADHKIVLRMMGIVFDKKESTTDTFDNRAYKITYIANNSVAADVDVIKYALSGSTYTVLNNTDASLSFTAPATKSFSKWNTKADGSGTDYAAASTYSVTADLKLYAVWAS